MPTMTLLEMTQNILSAMDSDEVNSISDTVESLQVATVIKETYFEQFNSIKEPSFKGLIQLDGLGDINSPNYMKVPANVRNFDWIKYTDFRNNNKFTEVLFVTPEDYFDEVLNYTSSGNNVVSTVDPVSGTQYYIPNNRLPSYYTLFDNYHIAFNAVDLTYESTLHASKTVAFGEIETAFPLQDSFVPVLDAKLFPLLLAEAKSVCFINFKQISSSKEEQRAHRQRIRMQNDQYKSKPQQRGSRRIFNYARNR